MLRHPFASLLVASALLACGDNRNNDPGNSPDAGTPDAGPTEIPLDRAHAGGSPNAVALAGTRAYIAVGPRLAIWDLSATPPTLVGESPPLRGVIEAVATVGDRAYVAERLDLDSMIHVFDVTNPSSPVETHAFSVAQSAGYSVVRDLEAAPGRLYAADQEQGVVELDLANPDAPSIVQVVPLGGVAALTLVDARLYYTMQGFIGGASAGALDLDDNLADLGSSPLGNLQGVTFVTRDLAIGAGPDGIYVFDVSDPSDPIQRFHHGQSDMGPFARAIAAHGTTAWVPADDGLHVLDLTTPTAITRSGPIAVATTNVNATAANGSVLAIVTDRARLLSLDVSTPTQPGAPRTVDVTLCADCVGVDAVDATLYLADIVGGLRTASLATLAGQGRSAPLPVVPDTGGLEFVFEDVQVAGTHAFVADWLYGLRIFDVTSASAPTLVGSLATGGAPSAVAVVGDRAYVAEGTNGGWLRVVDIADRTKPALLGSIETSKAMDVVVRGTLAYVADESLFGPGGLKIYDVSNPAAITQVGVYDTDCLWASDVALVGNLAVVACASDGFHWVDISTPAAPSRVAVTELPNGAGAAISIATSEEHVVLGHNGGIIVKTLDPVAAPVATYATSWPVRALAIPSKGRIVAACGPGGVYQWQL